MDPVLGHMELYGPCTRPYGPTWYLPVGRASWYLSPGRSVHYRCVRCVQGVNGYPCLKVMPSLNIGYLWYSNQGGA